MSTCLECGRKSHLNIINIPGWVCFDCNIRKIPVPMNPDEHASSMFYLGGRRCTILSTTEEAIMYMHESDGGKVESITVQRDQWADHVKQQENKCQKSSDS